jgi:hypothetical protein
MPTTRRTKIRTSGYAARRSSFVTAFISDSDYEVVPVIGNLQIFIGALWLFPVNFGL